MVLLSILGLPIRIVRIPFSLALVVVGFKHRRRSFNLPIAGIDENKAQTIYYTLTRAAADSPSHQETPQNWLKCLQLAQIASSRILQEIDVVDMNLQFWLNRLRSGGNHFWFTLLRQGPVHFIKRLLQIFHISRQRHHAITSGTSGSNNNNNTVATDAELIEKRILILRLLLSELCEAASTVQHAASLLYLHHQPNTTTTTNTTNTSTSADHVDIDETFFSHADSAIKESLILLIHGFDALSSNIHTTLDQQYDDFNNSNLISSPTTTASERPLLLQALGRVLGIGGHFYNNTNNNNTTTMDSSTTDDVDSHPLEGSDSLIHSQPSSSSSVNRLSVNELLKLAEERITVHSNTIASTTTSSTNTTTINTSTTTTSVHGALVDARKHALLLSTKPSHRLIQLPSWLTMPSQAQQHWLHYTVAIIAITSSTIFLVKHSRLVGSHDLENWIKTAIDGLKGAWTEHVVDPLGRVQGELFNTFRRRPSIVSMAEYEADRDSLQRMLDDFSVDYVKKRGAKAIGSSRRGSTSSSNGSSSSTISNTNTSNTASSPPQQQQSIESTTPTTTNTTTTTTTPTVSSVDNDAELLQGMKLMMHSYENELKQPIRNLVSGDLMRSLLIQVQKLKVDTESAMLEIDQILKANELSISLVAAIPAFAIAGLGLYGIAQFVTPAPPDPRREAVNARIAMIEVERAFEALAILEEQQEKEEEYALRTTPSTVVTGSNRGGAFMEAQGMALYRVAVAYTEAELLFKRHRGLLTSAGDAEWPNMQSDLLELAVPGSAVQKLRTAQRMMRVYAIYQQF